MATAEAEILDFRDPINVVIMNVSGPGDGKGTAERRRRLIANVLISREPDLVLFQEFKWKGVRSKLWNASPLPDHYVYNGNTEASIMYDSRRLKLTTLPQTNLQAPLDELKRKHKVTQDFTPLARSSIRLLKTTESDEFKVLVVSWHGVNKFEKATEKNKSGRKKKGRGGETPQKKNQQFKDLQVYLKDLSEREDAAVLIGGDFNINMSYIKKLVLPEFILYDYTPSERRKGRNIDYFMASPALTLTDVDHINLIALNAANDDRRTRNLHKLCDHDPICTTVTRRRPIEE